MVKRSNGSVYEIRTGRRTGLSVLFPAPIEAMNRRLGPAPDGIGRSRAANSRKGPQVDGGLGQE